MKIQHKKIIFNMLLLVFGLTAQSQNTISTAGGDTSGSGGNSSFSIGQIVYSTITSSNGSVAQGVQQPFEISTVLGVDVPSINLELVVYPNPTANFLTLSFSNVTLSASNFQLFDMNGKIIESKKS